MRQQFRLVTVLGVVVATLPALKYAPSVERVGSVESALESAVSWPVRESIVDRVLAAAKRTTTNTAGHREVDLGEGHHFVLVPAGSFRMGSDEGLDDERPTRDIELDDYWIAKYPVTVGQFRAFVEATGYVTDAESARARGNGRVRFPRRANEVTPGSRG